MSDLPHLSVYMHPNPWWTLEWFLTGAPRSTPYVKVGEGITYRCREGQIRGKAQKKALKKARQQRRGV